MSITITNYYLRHLPKPRAHGLPLDDEPAEYLRSYLELLRTARKERDKIEASSTPLAATYSPRFLPTPAPLTEQERTNLHGRLIDEMAFAARAALTADPEPIGGLRAVTTATPKNKTTHPVKTVSTPSPANDTISVAATSAARWEADAARRAAAAYADFCKEEFG